MLDVKCLGGEMQQAGRGNATSGSGECNKRDGQVRLRWKRERDEGEVGDANVPGGSS